MRRITLRLLAVTMATTAVASVTGIVVTSTAKNGRQLGGMFGVSPVAATVGGLTVRGSTGYFVYAYPWALCLCYLDITPVVEPPGPHGEPPVGLMVPTVEVACAIRRSWMIAAASGAGVMLGTLGVSRWRRRPAGGGFPVIPFGDAGSDRG